MLIAQSIGSRKVEDADYISVCENTYAADCKTPCIIIHHGRVEADPDGDCFAEVAYYEVDAREEENR